MAQVPTPFQLYRENVRHLSKVQKAVAKLIEDKVGDDLLFSGLVEVALKTSKEIRETMHSEMRLRKELAEIRDIDFREATDEQIKALINSHAKRRGLRDPAFYRNHMSAALTELGWSEAQVAQIMDKLLPIVDIQSERLSSSTVLRKSYDRLDKQIEELGTELDADLLPELLVSLEGASVELVPTTTTEETGVTESEPEDEGPKPCP